MYDLSAALFMQGPKRKLAKDPLLIYIIVVQFHNTFVNNSKGTSSQLFLESIVIDALRRRRKQNTNEVISSRILRTTELLIITDPMTINFLFLEYLNPSSHLLKELLFYNICFLQKWQEGRNNQLSKHFCTNPQTLIERTHNHLKASSRNQCYQYKSFCNLLNHHCNFELQKLLLYPQAPDPTGDRKFRHLFSGNNVSVGSLKLSQLLLKSLLASTKFPVLSMAAWSTPKPVLHTSFPVESLRANEPTLVSSTIEPCCTRLSLLADQTMVCSVSDEPKVMLAALVQHSSIKRNSKLRNFGEIPIPSVEHGCIGDISRPYISSVRTNKPCLIIYVGSPNNDFQNELMNEFGSGGAETLTLPSSISITFFIIHSDHMPNQTISLRHHPLHLQNSSCSKSIPTTEFHSCIHPPSLSNVSFGSSYSSCVLLLPNCTTPLKTAPKAPTPNSSLNPLVAFSSSEKVKLRKRKKRTNEVISSTILRKPELLRSTDPMTAIIFINDKSTETINQAIV
ncbi:hypothetical protein G4B88_000309 [Cannabis sativa]|uniref:Uncharacterized protein n=1 Tax=Cannabis sativa TaxID=3483 RepID=A0A7J6DVD7_CANSA|nr:hypothetical protein G4B88_000309 [Cannabis sativa]